MVKLPGFIVVSAGAFDEPFSTPLRLHYRVKNKLDFVDHFGQLPGNRSLKDPGLVSYQHPDKYPRRWPTESNDR